MQYGPQRHFHHVEHPKLRYKGLIAIEDKYTPYDAAPYGQRVGFFPPLLVLSPASLRACVFHPSVNYKKPVYECNVRKPGAILHGHHIGMEARR